MRLHAYLDDGVRVGLLDAAGLFVRRVPALDGGLDLALAEGRYDDAIATAGAGSDLGEAQPAADLDPLPALEFPGKIVCVGLNYRGHLAEQGREVPDRPTLFAKFGNAIIGDGEPIVRPEGTRALDLECELGVVIGRHTRRVAAGDAMGHVAGYVVANDVTARDWQGNAAALAPGEHGDGQWLRAKGSDTFLPIGPVFATSDELDPGELGLRSWRIPGSGPQAGRRVAMQDASTSDMIWPVAVLIEFVSRAISLEPGDLILTGTPAGVGVFRRPPIFLQPGDRVRCEVDGLGWVENPVVDWTAVRDDTDTPNAAHREGRA